MGWSYGFVDGRDVGYGVPATCDYPTCKKKIDRGLGYVCAEQQIGGGENGCGLFFCGNHADGMGFCERCSYNQEIYDEEKDNWKDLKAPFDPKPDHPVWLRWKLKDSSWEQWRESNPDEVAKIKTQLGA